MSVVVGDNVTIVDASADSLYTVSSNPDTSIYLDGSVAHTSDSSLLVVTLNPHFAGEYADVSIYKNGTESASMQFRQMRIENVTSDMERRSKMIDENASYQLLRTNPKFTGNIKVVVDSSSNVFIDTFPITKELSKDKYKKVSINPNVYYGKSLSTVFRGVTSDDVYGISEFSRDIFSTVNDFSKEFETTYNSGARTNRSRLYDESYSLLAPLCIRRELPDFFLIFKVDKDMSITDDNERIKSYIKNGKLVKSFDFREGSALGTFIRKIYEESDEYTGYSFKSYDVSSYASYNTYTGIGIDTGILSDYYENADNKYTIKNQVDLNNTISEGFERNRIVVKDIVNFEFMFNDEDVDDYSINSYFGLYVRLNGYSETFGCLRKESGKWEFDNKDVSIYKDILKLPLIYGISTENGFIRLTEEGVDTELEILNTIATTPGKNVFSSSYETVDVKDNLSEYTCFELKESPKAGEIYRLVDTSLNIKYNVIITNDNDSLMVSDSSLGFGDVVTRTYSNYNTYDISLYIGDETLALDGLIKAFNRLGDCIHAEYGYDNSYVSLHTSFEGYFQFISANTSIKDNEITNENITKILINGELQDTVIDPTEEWASIDIFPAVSFATSYAQTKTISSGYYLVESNPDKSMFKTTVLYYADSSTLALYDGVCLPSYSKRYPYMIHLPYYAGEGISKIALYNASQINIGVCSIMQVKDFDITIRNNNEVLDTATTIGIKSDYSSIEKVDFNEEYFYEYVFPKTDASISSSYTPFDISAGEFLSISTFVPTCCKWKSVGTDSRGIPHRVMVSGDNLGGVSSYYDIYNDASTLFGLVESLNPSSRKYVNNSPYSTIADSSISNEGKYAISSILEGKLSISDIIYKSSNSENVMSTVYTTGNNSVDFTSGGVKFRISTNNTDAINVHKYRNYSAAFVQAKSSNKLKSSYVDVIIDETAKEILVVMYAGVDFMESDTLKSNLFRISTISTPSDIISNEGGSYYIPINIGISKYLDSSTKQPSAVFFTSIVEEQKYSRNHNFLIIDCSKGDISITDNYLKMSKNGKVYIDGSLCTLGDNETKLLLSSTTNPMQGYAYYDERVEVSSKENSLKYGDFKNLIKDANFYIKDENGYKFYSKSSGIISARVQDAYYSDDSNMYTNTAYILPKMKNMLNFEYSDASINNYMSANLNGSNSIVSGVNSIDRLWIHKVIPQDASASGYFGVDVLSDWSIMKDSFDSNFYLYTEDGGKSTVSGYTTGCDVNNFFVSSIVKLPSDIVISEWLESTFSVNGDVTFNISKNVRHSILSNSSFIKYWKKYPYSTDNDKLKYIENIFISEFLMPDVALEVYKNSSKTSGGIVIERNNVSEDTNHTKLSNISNIIYLKNGDYYLKINNMTKGLYKIKLSIPCK